MGRKRRLKAADFGDNPKIRRSHGEHKNVNVSQPWETHYEKNRKKILKRRKEARRKKHKK